MRRTQDLVIARLRQIALRWTAGPPRAAQPVAARPTHRALGAAPSGTEPPVAPEDPAEPPVAAVESAEPPGAAVDSAEQPGAAVDSAVPLVAAAPEPHPDAGPGPHPRVWIRLLGILGVLVLLAGAAGLVRSWPAPQPIVAPERPSDVASPARIEPMDGFGAASVAPTAATSLVVHVAGQVRKPGVVVLPAGSRVADAVEAAGGLRRGATLGATNLARLLVDGERVEVGGEQAAASGAGAPAGAGSAAGALPTLVDLNAATAEQLDALPGIGPVTAAKILAWRAAHGRFSIVDELAEVPGIGPKTLAELRPHVRV